MRKAYFAGGCFWCITPIFKIYKATSVTSGYCGGDEVNPKYEDVPAEDYHQDYYLKNPEAFQKEMEESGRNNYFKN